MSYSLAFHESVDLVVRVHRLMVAGQGETAEANMLRAKSEKPWYEMSDEEQDLVNGLSEDLYDIVPGVIGPEQTSISASEFAQLLLANRWPEALCYLRNNKSQIKLSELALHRGGIWAHLSEDEVAFEFYRYAYSNSPDLPESAKILFLQSAISVRAFELVDEFARSLLRPATPPALRLMAVQWLFAKMMIESETVDDVALREVLSNIEIALSSLGTTNHPEYLRLMIRNANLTAACCYSNFGEWDRARVALANILDQYPDDVVAVRFGSLLNSASIADAMNGRSIDERRRDVRLFALNDIIPAMSPRMSLAA